MAPETISMQRLLLVRVERQALLLGPAGERVEDRVRVAFAGGSACSEAGGHATSAGTIRSKTVAAGGEGAPLELGHRPVRGPRREAVVHS